jgi:hypothetical protein
VHMRTALLLMMFNAGCWAGSIFGTWKMDPSRSRLIGQAQPKSFTVRIEPHAKGEVFTLDRIESDGRITSSSTILYLDGAARGFQDFGCSGTQSSRRLDGRTVQIQRVCANGEWLWLLRQTGVESKELIIDVIEKRHGRPNSAWRMVLERQ